MKPALRKFSQPSWRLRHRWVEAYVTERGGHLGPVTFCLGRKRVQPFAVAPWHAEKTRGIPPILKVLRGDFFCLPFGGNAQAYRSERHPPHGETANTRWHCVTSEPDHLHLRLNPRVRPGQVDKHVWIRPGESVIYQRHVISGMSGPMNPGHHATLCFPDQPGRALISTSRFAWGEVSPQPLEDPSRGGYSCLTAGARFRALHRVPSADGTMADLSAYPARRGFEDLVMLVGDGRSRLGWTAVACPGEGYVWFALKDPRVLTNTILWHSNGGRHYPPWNGRHLNTLGLEEVTSYFHYGLAESAARNPVSQRGGVTCLRLSARQPLVVNYIMAVAPIPRDFDHVRSVTTAADGRSVRLTSRSGRSVTAALDVDFLYWR